MEFEQEFPGACVDGQGPRIVGRHGCLKHWRISLIVSAGYLKKLLRRDSLSQPISGTGPQRISDIESVKNEDSVLLDHKTFARRRRYRLSFQSSVLHMLTGVHCVAGRRHSLKESLYLDTNTLCQG